MQDVTGNILISGASGILGTAIGAQLEEVGYKVYALDRHSTTSPFHVDLGLEKIHLDPDIPLQAVINLAGENISGKRWNARQKRRIIESRTRTTRLLASAIARSPQQPKVFLSASAIGFYGPTGIQSVDESAPSGSGFLADVARQWEAATQPAIEAGIRTVHLRFGVVITKKAGVLGEMLLPFKLGLGGVVGNGQQWMSWTSLEDAVAVALLCLENEGVNGPVNVVAPESVTNHTFTKILGKSLHRPTISPFLKAPVVRLLFGEMGDALLLSSARVIPARLQELGFQWQFPTLAEKLRDEFSN